MKKYFLIMAAVLFAFTACTKSDETTPKEEQKENPGTPEEKPDLRLTTPSIVDLDVESCQYTVKFTAGKAWTATLQFPDEDLTGGVALSAEKGAAGDVELKVTFDSVPEGYDGKLTGLEIKAGDSKVGVMFFQGFVFWSDLDDEPTFGVDGGEVNFIVITNLNYTLEDSGDEWAVLTKKVTDRTLELSIKVAANGGYDKRSAYARFTFPDVQLPVLDDDGNETGETYSATATFHVFQEGNVEVAWLNDFFWGMFSEGGRHSIALLDDYMIINAPVDANNGTGGLMVFQKSDGKYLKNITVPNMSFTGVTTDDAGNVILTAGGDYPIDESTWSLIVDQQTPLTVFVIKKADALAILGGGDVPALKPIINYPNGFYGYGLSNVRVTGDVTGTAVIDLVSAAYQETEPTSQVVSWQVTGGVTTNEPTANRVVPSSMSIWTPNDLVAKHITADVNGPLYYMGYDGNYQLWYADNMTAEWDDVLDSGSTWVEGYQCLDIIDWNGHKYLGLIGETYFAWYGWGSLPSYLWILNIDDPKNPVRVAKTPCDVSGNEGTWQYGATADLEMVLEGNDLAVYCVDAGVSTYHKIVYPAL